MKLHRNSMLCCSNLEYYATPVFFPCMLDLNVPLVPLRALLKIVCLMCQNNVPERIFLGMGSTIVGAGIFLNILLRL
jgi:hypothetical protein